MIHFRVELREDSYAYDEELLLPMADIDYCPPFLQSRGIYQQLQRRAICQQHPLLVIIHGPSTRQRINSDIKTFQRRSMLRDLVTKMISMDQSNRVDRNPTRSRNDNRTSICRCRWSSGICWWQRRSRWRWRRIPQGIGCDYNFIEWSCLDDRRS